MSLIVSPNFEVLKGKKDVQNFLSVTPQHIACCSILCIEKTINKCFLNKCSKPGDSVWGSHSPSPLLKTHHTQLFWLDSLKLNLWPQPTGLPDLTLAHFSDCIPFFSLLFTKLQPPNLLSVYSSLLSSFLPWDIVFAAPSCWNALWLAPADHSGSSPNATTSEKASSPSIQQLDDTHSHPDVFSSQHISQSKLSYLPILTVSPL